MEAVRTEEQDDWHRKKCRKELANHFGIFKDVHGQQFMSTVDMKIVYKESNTVYNGNILAAHKVRSEYLENTNISRTRIEPIYKVLTLLKL